LEISRNADDQALVRSGLRALLATSNDIQVIGEAVLRSVPWDLNATAARFSWRFLGSLPGLGALIRRNLGTRPVRPRASQLTGADPQTHRPRCVSRLWRMDDSDILARIREMVDAEHELRHEMQENPGEVTDAAQRLHELEESLDQFWDLLRQRRAHREFAQDPNDSRTRPRQQVEGYLQ